MKPSPPFQSKSGPSRQAAEEIRPKTTTLRGLVFAAIERAARHGMTDQEIQNQLGMDPSTQRPRRVELVERGLVIDSGTTRKTRAGRSATVWVAAPGQLSLWR